MTRVASPRPKGARAGSGDVYREVCDSMASGVVLIDREGRIETCNPAAATILGLDRGAVVGRSFAEVFVTNPDLDELNEAIVAAIHDGVVGYRTMATVSVSGRPVPLAVATSYLSRPPGRDDDRRAVVAVFSDVSELEKLKARESELATDLAAKHEELRSAYLDLEARNGELDTLLRKVQVIRIGASVGVVALIVAIGAYAWTGSSTGSAAAVPDEDRRLAEDPRLATVAKGAITSSITVPGVVRPRAEVAVNSPIGGQVGALHVQRGQSVSQGQPLLDLDVTQVQIHGRRARAAYLKAKAEADEFSDWAASVDVSRVRRAVAKARIAHEAANTRLEETGFLVERGLVPSASRDAAERELETRRLDLESAEQDLNAVVARGREGLEVARLELQNASAELESIDWALENATIVAPVAGVVVGLREATSGRGGALAAGASIQAGEHLLTIGDMEGVTVVGLVDEVDVGRIRGGQPARITGPAFAGIALDAAVVRVSSQATGGRMQHQLPSFEIAAAVDRMDERQRAAVRLGMSAEMEIVIHHREDALSVPFGAVFLADGKSRVRVWDEGEGGVRTVDVTTGITTVDAVEILSGLEAGDRVVAP